MTEPISASAATGLSEDTIRHAVNAGDLKANAPKVAQRQITKLVILRTELERWLTNAA